MSHYLRIAPLLLACLPFSMHAASPDLTDLTDAASAVFDATKDYLESQEEVDYDTDYVEEFDEPWFVRLSLLSSGTSFSSHMHEGSRAAIKSALSSSMEFGISYRGFGLSYSHQLSSSSDHDFIFSSYGNRWGGEFRLHGSHSLEGEITPGSGLLQGHPYTVDEGDMVQHNILINGYYVFNHKQFSYPAAMSSSMRQLISCGSPMLGIAYYRSRIKVQDNLLPSFWDEVNGLRISQLAVGAGYAYNWVRGSDDQMLIHASLMPMLALLHFNKVYSRGDSQGLDEDYGMAWKNNTNQSVQQKSSGFADNLDLRFSCVFRTSFQYNISDRMVAGYCLVYNRHDIGSSNNLRLTMHDWSTNAFVGYRF